MPRRYDRAETSRLLLDAAVEEFSGMGIHGARIDRIAQNAGTNKSGIYTYFGNKEEFFAATIDRVMADMAAAVPISAVPISAEDLPGYAGDLFDYVCAHPEVVRLFEHEATHYADNVVAVPNYAARAASHADRVAVIAAATNSEGDAQSLLMSIIAMSYWFVAAPQVVSMIYGSDHEQARLRYREHIVRTVAAVAGSQAPTASTER